jgi:hypothetical protein
MSQEANTVDIRERGRGKDGQAIFSDRRLYVQFLAFGGCPDHRPAKAALEVFGQPAVLYLDSHDPRGIGLLLLAEDPAFFVTKARDFLNTPPFTHYQLKPEFTMFGRTYTIGYENDLDEALFARPKSRIFDPSLAWAIWYPVRRTKGFERLPEDQRLQILMDHGSIGQSFGRAGLAYDVRLDCHGLDRDDADFVIGVLGQELIGPSAVVGAMRKSLQTAEFIEKLGPFFIGKVAAQIGN